MTKALCAVALSIAIFCLGCAMWGTPMVRGSSMPPAISKGLPAMYEVASETGINLSVVDMHRYGSSDEGKWVLTLGLVVENGRSQEAYLDPARFEVIDSAGRHRSPLSSDTLKNPLDKSELDPGETAFGSLAFEIDQGEKPVLLAWEETGIAVRLDKDVRPPGELYSLGSLISCKTCSAGIEGVSVSDGGRIVSVNYILKNTGPGVISLADRDFGRFAVLTDSHGISYSAINYKMLSPAIPPGGSAEGYLTYAVPEDSSPRYLVFWPPDEDAIIFDMEKKPT